MSVLRTLPTQLRHDFGFTPTLVDHYVTERDRADALRAARQVTGVGTYLSKIVCGEARMFENAVYATLIVCIDEASDDVGEPLYPMPIDRAIQGDPPTESLDIVPLAVSVARSPGIETALRRLANWQDQSREQEGDIPEHRTETITHEKGGWSAVGHVHAMCENPTEEDLQFAHRFGFLAQLLDDYLDQPDDEADGVSTMFTDGTYTGEMLSKEIDKVEQMAHRQYDRPTAVNDLFAICRTHKLLADVRNRTRFDPSRLLPWYL